MTGSLQPKPEKIGGRVRLLPSLLSADFSHLGADAKEVLSCGVHGLHADIMDGRYVPPITYGADVVAAIVRETGASIDAHLMIIKPERQIDFFAEAGVEGITVHAETCPHLHRILQQIRDVGCKAGVAFNPATAIGDILHYIMPLLDRVMIMSVNPGWSGQSFIPETLHKVRETARILGENWSNAEIQVDGGVNNETVGELVRAGATELVAGAAVFKGNIAENIASLRNEVEKALSV